MLRMSDFSDVPNYEAAILTFLLVESGTILIDFGIGFRFTLADIKKYLAASSSLP